jgi:micrococcal nuclease
MLKQSERHRWRCPKQFAPGCVIQMLKQSERHRWRCLNNHQFAARCVIQPSAVGCAVKSVPADIPTVNPRALALALLLVLAGCTTGLDTGGTPAPGEGVTATVTAVVDGDTVKVRLANGTTDTVRLVGVDTPEVHDETDPAEFEGVPDTAAGRSCLRTWGERASEHAKERLDGREVRLTFDTTLDHRGYYGRLLAYVTIGNESFNRVLVAEGYARMYDSDFTRKADYRDAERRARERALGLWACATESPPTASATESATATPTGTPLADGGAALAIVEVHADAEGNDNENLNDEYVVLENRGNESRDLTGWTVRDEAGHAYTVGNVTLDPDERVTLHTGTGTDTAMDLYWGRSQAVWNNGGDTVTVRDAAGAVVAERSYG